MKDAIRFSKLKELKGYDLVVTSGQLAHFASVQNPKNIWYCHTPNRALYDLRNEVRARLGFLWRPFFDIWADLWKPFDKNSVKHVNRIVVNSNNVKKRVKDFYGRDSEVVYPPVDLKKFRYKRASDYWLSVQRVEPEKRIEMQLKVFEKFPKEKLVLVGPGKYGKEYLERIAKMVERMPNVEWKKDVSEKELVELYSSCKALIQTPIDEDFGLIAIEAMASGKPCIAVDEGGFRETIVHGKTGLLLKEPYEENLAKVVENFGKYKFDPKTCQKRAKDFSEDEFMKKMKKAAKEVSVSG